jgi:hypothetical protein
MSSVVSFLNSIYLCSDDNLVIKFDHRLLHEVTSGRRVLFFRLLLLHLFALYLRQPSSHVNLFYYVP